MSLTVYPWVIGSFTPAQPGGLKPWAADNIGQSHTWAPTRDGCHSQHIHTGTRMPCSPGTGYSGARGPACGLALAAAARSRPTAIQRPMSDGSAPAAMHSSAICR